MRQGRWGIGGGTEADGPGGKRMSAVRRSEKRDICWGEVWRREENYTICFILLWEQSAWWKGERKRESGKGQTAEGETGLRPVHRVQRIMVRHRREKWLRMTEQVWCIAKLFTCCIPAALLSSLPFFSPLCSDLFFLHLSIHFDTGDMNTSSIALQCLYETSGKISEHQISSRWWYSDVYHEHNAISRDVTTHGKKDTSTLQCWCRPCGWGSWALDTAEPVAASWRS